METIQDIRAAIEASCGGWQGEDDATLLRHWRQLSAADRAAMLKRVADSRVKPKGTKDV